MTITLRLSEQEESRLAERAIGSGHDLAGYVHLLIERDLQAPQSLDELLAPIQRHFEESGMTDDDLDALVEEAREEVWQEKQVRRDQGQIEDVEDASRMVLQP